jgi:hypothetical protein
LLINLAALRGRTEILVVYPCVRIKTGVGRQQTGKLFVDPVAGRGFRAPSNSAIRSGVLAEPADIL